MKFLSVIILLAMSSCATPKMVQPVAKRFALVPPADLTATQQLYFEQSEDHSGLSLGAVRQSPVVHPHGGDGDDLASAVALRPHWRYAALVCQVVVPAYCVEHLLADPCLRDRERERGSELRLHG